MKLYQKTYGKNMDKNVVVAVIGYAQGDPDESSEADMGYVILQPLGVKSKCGSERLLEGESPVTYGIAGDSYCVPFEVFMGKQEPGHPNYEEVPLKIPVEELDNLIQPSIKDSIFALHTGYIHTRISTQHKMLHVLGYYRNRLTNQVVQFLGTATAGPDPYVVVQRPGEGSLDPVEVRPVGGTADPITLEGVHDIWNGLQLIPMKEFTSLYWFSDTECKTLYEYLGLEYRGTCLPNQTFDDLYRGD